MLVTHILSTWVLLLLLSLLLALLLLLILMLMSIFVLIRSDVQDLSIASVVNKVVRRRVTTSKSSELGKMLESPGIKANVLCYGSFSQPEAVVPS